MAGARVRLAVLGVLALALAALPFLADKFYVQLATKILILAIFAMSLDLLVGYTGLVSLGHAAFFGFAGYLLALVSPQYEAANLWTSLAIALAGSAVLALVIGALVLRTSGIYFIMVTLAFGEMLFHLFHDTSIAGGSDGIYVYVRPVGTIFGWQPFDFEDFTHFYLVVLVAALGVYALLRMVLASPFGRVIVGIRVNEHRMRSLGYHTFRYKLVCFVLAGTLAGLAGYLAAVQFGVVNPDMLGFHVSASALMMLILGGMGTLVGPAIGAAVMMTLELLFQKITDHWLLPMGVFIVLVALLLPRGLVGLVTGARAKDDSRG
ncbi:MAG: branched-chain amino acid ABC transporter permease [Burkholderiales bacterium]|nr:branched-chain amino acid ABC transporter permease [Burkholderiales bacterium]